MKILITGVGGFVGRSLLARLLEIYGSERIIVVSSNIHETCQTLLCNYIDCKIDADRESLSDVKIVIHCGAFTPKNGGDVNNIELANSNIAFTTNLMRLPFGTLTKVIYISSLDVYDPSAIWDEESLTVPPSLYGLSKLYCEQIIRTWSVGLTCQIQILRIGHVYGPGEEQYSKFIPLVFKNILAGKPIELWGGGKALRSYIYIDDVVNCIILSMAERPLPLVINIVGGYSIEMHELVQMIGKIAEVELDITYKPTTADPIDYVFDNSLMKSHLIQDETLLSDGLRDEYLYMKRLL
jgi:nucleoside-diphosphate-sugar epimerase